MRGGEKAMRPVEVVEVGARDGLQNEREIIGTDGKLGLIIHHYVHLIYIAFDQKIEPAENPAAKDAADAAGQWVVQLGAYKDAGKVRNLMSKLKGINVPAYTEKTETPQGSLTRVRAGPFASQEAAEKARGRVKIIGVDGPVAPK